MQNEIIQLQITDGELREIIEEHIKTRVDCQNIILTIEGKSKEHNDMRVLTNIIASVEITR